MSMSSTCYPSPRELSAIADQMADGTASTDLMRSTLLDLAERGESGTDLLTFAQAFRSRALPVYTRHAVVMDLCGTGGAAFRTFNVSTVASFVVAGCGVPVAKHGNRSVNGVCGSADLMGRLGVDVEMSPQTAGRILDRSGITFLFAPTYHPALRHVAPVRRELRRRTIFNLLGPLLNPVRTERRQLMGVADARLLNVLPPILPQLGIGRAGLVHGHPGMDEISTLGPSSMVEMRDGICREHVVHPRSLHLSTPMPEEVREIPPEKAAGVAIEILSGKDSPLADMVMLNAAGALMVFGKVPSLEEGLELARASVLSGAALERLHALVDGSKELGR